MHTVEVSAIGDRGDEAGFVLPFEEIGAELLGVVGGKAANLGELVRAGFPVPPVAA